MVVAGTSFHSPSYYQHDHPQEEHQQQSSQSHPTRTQQQQYDSNPIASATDSSASGRPEDAAYFITVTDPVQHSEGMNKYTSYRVQVRPPHNLPPTGESPGSTHAPASNMDMFPPTHYSAVLRRYSDFAWLHSALQKERAGAILPPLPEKQAVSRFSLTFIEERRGLLERFLRRVAVHPELYDSVALDTFLRADDAAFYTAKNAKGGVKSMSLSHSVMYGATVGGGGGGMAESMTAAGGGGGGMSSMMMGAGMGGYDASASMTMSMNHGHAPNPYNPYAAAAASTLGASPHLPPKKKEGIKKWFAETKTSIAGELVRSPDDDLFLEIDRYVEGLEKQIKQVQTQATALVKKNKDIASGLFEFGVAFHILGQSEADDLGKALSQMGAAADELSGVSLAHSEREMAQFEEPLKDYLRTIHSVKAALQKRHEKRLTYTTCLSEVNSKRTTLAKLRATPGSEAKAYGAEMSLKRGEIAANVAREEFATVSQRVLREVDRFKREKGDEMRRVVLDYINLQIEYNQKMEQVWADLLPKLEAIQNVQGDGSDGRDGRSGGGNVGGEREKEQELFKASHGAQPQQQQQQQQAPQYNMHQGMSNQNMYGLEGSIQYRDTTDIVSGM